MDDLLKELFIGVLRFIGWVLWEIIFEGLIRGAGYLICRIFRREVDFESGTVLVVGIVFWVIVITLAIVLAVNFEF